MGLFTKQFRSTEQTLFLKDPELYEIFAQRYRTKIGQTITPEGSLRISPWYAGVQIIAGSIAAMPCVTYKRAKTGAGRTRAYSHPVYDLLHDEPNEWMTAFEFIETSMGHLLTWGNSFALIERYGSGALAALWPVAPNRVRIEVVNGRLVYYHHPINGGEQRIPMENMLHVRGLSSDGILGYSPVDLAREQLGLTKAEEEYRERFFLNDARPGAIVEYPGRMDDQAYERFKKDWKETYAGLGNKYKIGFLEAGLKWHDVGFPPEASQFIEGRKFQVEEIARILRIPLVLLQSTEKATSWGTGIEQFKQGFVDFTLREWMTRWEKRFKKSLFTKAERQQYYVEFLADSLLRGDSRTRAEVLQIWRRNGIINADEWREIENKNPLPGGKGKEYIIESNMQLLTPRSALLQAQDEQQKIALGNGNGNGNGISEDLTDE